MADAKLDNHAKEVYETLCGVLDKKGIKYENIGKDSNGDWTVRFTGKGEDLPMECALFVDVERQLVCMMSRLPFSFSEEKRVDGAVVVTYANNKITDGYFDYNMETGRIIFKTTSSIRNSTISEELLNYMLSICITTVDEFNDKFLMIDKGLMTPEQFFAKY